MIQPTYDRVLVKRDESEETTPGGIVLPDNAKTKTNRGEVLAVGPGRETWESASHSFDGTSLVGVISAPCVVGDVVLFGAYAGQEVKDGQETYLLLNAEDILAVVKGSVRG